MLRGVVGAIQRRQYRGGRPGWSACVANRLGAFTFAAGIGPNQAVTLEVRGHKSGRTISFPVVVADYQGERYLVAMLGQKTNWVRNLRADGRAVLRRGRREDVSLVEDLSDKRAAILRRYLELAAGHVRFSRSTATRRLRTSSGSSTSTLCFGSLERRACERGLFGAEAGPGLGGDVACGDFLPAVGARQDRVGDVAAGLVAQHDWRTVGVGEVLIAPLHEDHDRSEQVSAGGRQPVLVTVGIARVGHLVQQPVFDEGAKA
jgi:F420H(2)-dependent quinone reductase